MAYAELMSNLLSFYEFLNEINDFSVESKGLENFSLDGDSLFEVLRISKKELDVLLKFIDQINEIEGFQKSKTKVTFDEKKYTALGKYLSCFDFECFLNSLERQENQPCRLRLKQNAKEEILSHFSELLFKGVLNSISHLSEWSIHTQSCCLYPNDLALCLLTYWCNQPLPKNFPTIEVTNFVNTLKTVCSLNGKFSNAVFLLIYNFSTLLNYFFHIIGHFCNFSIESDVVSVEYNVESPWWQQLRSYISTSPSTVHGLFAALGCRSVTIFAEQERELAHKKGGKKNKSNYK